PWGGAARRRGGGRGAWGGVAARAGRGRRPRARPGRGGRAGGADGYGRPFHSLLRVDDHAVVDEDRDVELLVAGHVGERQLARLLPAAAVALEDALLVDRELEHVGELPVDPRRDRDQVAVGLGHDGVDDA